jgi:hypothetical protein
MTHIPVDNRTIGETPIESVVEQILGGKKNVVLDHTILSTLMACPRLTDFRFNLNLQAIGGKSNSIECGLIVHIFLEYYYKAIIGGMKRDQAFGFGIAAAELFIRGCSGCTDFMPTSDIPKPSCGHKENTFPGVKNTPKDSEGNRTGWQWVLDTLDQYHIFYKNDHWQPLDVETVRGKILYEDDEVRILWKAKIDVIFDTNQGIFSSDHKSMKMNRDTNSMNNQFMGQCRIMDTNQVFINKIGFQTTLKPVDKFKRTPVGYTNDRLLEWQGEILPYYAKLLIMYAETGYYPPNFNACEGKYGPCAFYKDVCSDSPANRERQLKQYFYVGAAWNPINDED